MKAKEAHLEEFLVAGISIRTINNGQAGIDINNLWDRFYKDGITEKIPGKLSSDLYCIYTDYESDYTGYYTCILGCKVSSIAALPHGIEGCIVPAADFKVYESKGEIPQSVLATWQQIWDSDIKRSYKADFDVYSSESWSGGGVATYVGIK